jgi:hypothetical protein
MNGERNGQCLPQVEYIRGQWSTKQNYTGNNILCNANLTNKREWIGMLRNNAVPASLEVFVVLLLNDTKII